MPKRNASPTPPFSDRSTHARSHQASSFSGHTVYTHKVDTRLYVTTDYASMDCFGSGVRRREAAVAKKEEGESKRQLSPWRRFTRAHAHCWPVGHLAGWAGPSGFSSRTTALDVVAAAGGAGCLVGRGAA